MPLSSALGWRQDLWTTLYRWFLLIAKKSSGPCLPLVSRRDHQNDVSRSLSRDCEEKREENLANRFLGNVKSSQIRRYGPFQFVKGQVGMETMQAMTTNSNSGLFLSLSISRVEQSTLLTRIISVRRIGFQI
jgi:hypothetical protein